MERSMSARRVNLLGGSSRDTRGKGNSIQRYYLLRQRFFNHAQKMRRFRDRCIPTDGTMKMNTMIPNGHKMKVRSLYNSTYTVKSKKDIKFEF